MSIGSKCGNATTTQARDSVTGHTQVLAAEVAIFDPDRAIDGLATLQDCWGYRGKLAEVADSYARFHQHTDPDLAESVAYFLERTRDDLVAMFPSVEFPPIEEFDDGFLDLNELIIAGVRTFASRTDGVIRWIVGEEAGEVMTIEMANDDESAIAIDSPVHVFRTTKDGSRQELTLITAEQNPNRSYHELVKLLELADEILAEGEARTDWRMPMTAVDA